MMKYKFNVGEESYNLTLKESSTNSNIFYFFQEGVEYILENLYPREDINNFPLVIGGKISSYNLEVVKMLNENSPRPNNKLLRIKFEDKNKNKTIISYNEELIVEAHSYREKEELNGKPIKKILEFWEIYSQELLKNSQTDSILKENLELIINKN